MSAEIAIVGLACRFPGATGPSSFWRLLSEGRRALASPPEGRATYCPEMPSRQAGYLDNPALFDAAFFHVSPREAAEMDPQQRIMLEIAWEAFEDAGYPAESLRQTRTAVYVGAMWRDYDYYVRRTKPNQHTLTGAAPALIAGRISHFFGLRGPSLVVETTTSSSLVAFHLACQSLQSGEATLALAGGVNLILSPKSTDELAAMGVLSPQDSGRPLDALADGYQRGEGAGAVVLKRVEDALRDGDRIHCFVRSTYVNHNGGGVSLATPNAASQEDLLQEAIRLAGITPDDLSYIEAHGTGTPAGDAVEIRALQAALDGRRTPIRVGSVKGNIGHLEAAAGIAGVIKVSLMLRNQSVPATCGYVNARTDLDTRILEIPKSLCSWMGPRIAGVSSFGLMGTNCHVLLEGPPGNDASQHEPRLLPFVLSAQSEKMLKEYAARLAQSSRDWLDADLAAICGTAARRRTHLRCRRGLAVRSVEELRAGLTAIAGGAETHQCGFWSEWISRFECGEPVDVDALAADLPLPERVEWPVRPWEHHTYWTGHLEASSDGDSSVHDIVAAVLGSEPGALHSGRTLIQLGLDSLMALELSERLKETYAVKIPPRRLLNGMLLSELAQTCSVAPDWEEARL
jgi:acyl transferase domain-containing protein/acyl carrier protein